MFTKFQIICANSSTPSSLAALSVVVEDDGMELREGSVERKEEKDPEVCRTVLRDLSKTIVALTPALPARRAIVSETFWGIACAILVMCCVVVRKEVMYLHINPSSYANVAKRTFGRV